MNTVEKPSLCGAILAKLVFSHVMKIENHQRVRHYFELVKNKDLSINSLNSITTNTQW